jgi:hypothetical protein
LGEGETVRVAIECEVAWSGRLVPDRPRHQVHLNLPFNYPRANEFPEWFTVSDDRLYNLTLDDQPAVPRTGAALREGVFLEVKPGQVKRLSLSASAR